MTRKPATSPDRLTGPVIETAIRLGVLALLIYWSLILVRPFVPIVIWSVVLTVALYPIFEWMSDRLGKRRRLAAVIITILSLVIVIGPVAWLASGLIDSFRTLSERFDFTSFTIPPPPNVIKDWPLAGNALYQFWELASTNFGAALGKIAPQVKHVGSGLLRIGADTGVGVIKFLASIIVAGFLFAPAPSLIDAIRNLSRKLNATHGEEFAVQAAATIRAISRGVIGISVLQAFLAGVGLTVAGIPQASLITFAILILGIIQVGPSIILIPIIIWSWTFLETTSALLFTAYMVPVNLLDNLLRPIVMGRGLKTPMIVILIGVIGGTLANGFTGLFLGPIVLAVVWELLIAWIRDR